MSIQITIIGTGQIGASFGLALNEHKAQLTRVGHDIDLGIARKAEKMGAFDRVDFNLPNSVRNADLVLLALPVDQIRPTLEIIAADLREGCVVMDTAAAKLAVIAWMEELLPANRFYVGLTPVINPQYIYEGETGLAGAHADLFKDGVMGIFAPPNTDPGALKMAADLTRLVGAAPMFSDPYELDGLMAAAHLLPQIMAAALLKATVDQPGWNEVRKLAGQPYHHATHPILRSTQGADLAAMAQSNRTNAVRVINDAIIALTELRQAVESEDPAPLAAQFKRLQAERESWLRARHTREWLQQGSSAAEMPTSSSIMGNLLGLGRRKPRK